MPRIEDWAAHLGGNAVVRRGEQDAPPSEATGVLVTTDVGRVRVRVRPGEQVRCFTRRRATRNGAKTVDIAVIEVNTGDGFVRLYLTPSGPILSSLDL